MVLMENALIVLMINLFKMLLLFILLKPLFILRLNILVSKSF